MGTEAHGLVHAAEAVLSDIVAIRRATHARPELGLRLPATQALIVEQLALLGLEPRLGESVTSVVALIEGARPGPTIILRADMDALPLQEDTGLEFASAIDGAMHACGHDTHVAMLIGAARLLVERRDALAGDVLLMFQPGEEGFHGARFMLDEGLLEQARTEVTGAFAIHITTRYPTRTVNLRAGAQLASGDTVRVTVTGRGGHASTPQLAADPIVAAAAMILALQTMVTREIDVFDPAVITIAQVAAGTTTNIIPETAFFAGTIRTVSDATREAMRANVRRVVESVAVTHGVAVEIEIEPGYPVTYNDPVYAAFVRDVAAGLLGETSVVTTPAPVMGAEDFSYVLQRVPGAFAFLGARPAHLDPATAPQNHSNRVVFDEQAMIDGVALYAAVALRHLAGA
jgi:hippurate hydrolase